MSKPLTDQKLTAGQRAKIFVQKSPARMAFIIAAVLYLITVIYTPASFNANAIGSIIMLTLLLSIASAGQTIVLIGGGMDFGVGAVMSSAAILTTTIMNGEDGHFPQLLVTAQGTRFEHGYVEARVGGILAAALHERLGNDTARSTRTYQTMREQFLPVPRDPFGQIVFHVVVCHQGYRQSFIHSCFEICGRRPDNDQFSVIPSTKIRKLLHCNHYCRIKIPLHPDAGRLKCEYEHLHARFLARSLPFYAPPTVTAIPCAGVHHNFRVGSG